MNPFKSIGKSICDLAVNMAPNAILDSLRRNHYDLVAREFNRAYRFNWKQASFSCGIDDFEDLTALFDVCPLNRGIIRQDFDEAAALFKAVRALPRRRGVEIGRFNGGSTLLIAVAVGEQGKLTSIDIEPQDDATLAGVLRQAGVLSRVELVVGDANKVKWEGELDFVFIDGDHSYDGARRDHNLWGGRVRAGGLIIHHDMANSRAFSTQWTELSRLRADILKKQGSELRLLREAGSMAIFQKTSGAWPEV